MTRLHCNEDLGLGLFGFFDERQINYWHTKKRVNITRRRKISWLLLKAHTAVVRNGC